MLINDANLSLMYQGFQTVYNEAYLKPTTYKDKVAMTVGSGSSQEVYGWVGLFPSMRQWVGSRVVNSLKASAFTITNLPV